MESYGNWLFNKKANKAYLYGSKMVNITLFLGTDLN